jgi:phosphotransferase system, enzyme I, PtsP
MPLNAKGPRLILRRLRQIMASPQTAQERLDELVQVIASNMDAQVCSVYLVRAGDILELFATVGLNAVAVHKTNLRVGEGLVGEIAARGAPLNLSDAQSHPNYAYRPETGEDIFHSLMGVPVLRSGRVVGVLAVQNENQRHYSDEEVEALETVAMVLAQLVGSGELIDAKEVHEGTFAQGIPPQLDGLTFAHGIAIGHVVLHEPRLEVTQLLSEDEELETARLTEAIDTLRLSIDNLIESPAMGVEGEHLEVLETYRMFAHDRGWVRRIQEAIDTGLTAEAAVQRVQVANRTRMARITDAYLRERLADLDDLSHRLIRHLMGLGVSETVVLPSDSIVVARNLGPAELMDYDRDNIRGVVLAEGSPSSHMVIVAKAMGIPVIGHIAGIVGLVDAGDLIILDGSEGEIYLLPTTDVVQSFRERVAAQELLEQSYVEHRDLPAITRDGVEINLNMNAGLLVDMDHLSRTGAAGVGLFRTELPFMVSATFPRLTAQRELYEGVLSAAGDKDVVFRTLDIGSDKVVPFIDLPKEENPAMGWRAVRLSLDRPALLRYQLRALIQASGGKSLNIMFPMIADVTEYLQCKEIFDREMLRHKRLKYDMPKEVKLGTMLEVPALAWQLETLLPHLDFVSVGSNDLMQFLFASDRSNTLLSGRYDLLSPAALSFFKMIIDTCDTAGKPLSVCGEAASDPLEALSLIALGMRNLSMPPSAIGPVKEMVRSLNLARAAEYVESLLHSPDHSLRTKLLSYARDHGVEI